MTLPFLKWAGGKRKQAASILSHMPEKIGTYYEPFVGGGAILFALADRHAGPSVICDANPMVVSAYRAVRDTPADVLAELANMLPTDRPPNAKEYYDVRASRPLVHVAERAAWLIYVNKVGHCGLYRVNKAGVFNVPYGHPKKPIRIDHKNLMACSAALKGVKVFCGDFGEVSNPASAGPGDVFYFDPPYAPVSATANFTSYTAGGFVEADHDRLAATAHALAAKGATVMVSGPASHDMREHYQRGPFKLYGFLAPRSIGATTGGNADVTEFLAVANGRK
jgi:DNA adenine methylase